MLSPNFLRCKETVKVPMGIEGHPGGHSSIKAWRTVRCAWPRTHRRGGPKCTFRFDDPGPPLRSVQEVAWRVAWFVFAIYLLIVVPMLLAGVIK